MKTQVSIVKCGNYNSVLVQERVRESVELLGGLDKFIKPNSKVLIKPNMLMARPPDAGITTHPEVMRAVIKMLKELGCKVYVGDSPSVWGQYIENVDEVYSVTGIKQLCFEEDVELISLEKRRMRKSFPLASILDECDHVINMPKLKTHELMLMTAGVKNLFGLVSGTFKTELHKNHFQPRDFAKVLVDIYQEILPSLTIVDAIVAMEGDGPATSGKLRNLGLLVAGKDCVAVDSVLATLMGIKPLDVFTTREAFEKGVGVCNLSDIEVLGIKPDQLKIDPFLLPTSAKRIRLPEFLLRPIKRLIRYRPFVLRKKCIKCLACVKICPNKCIALKKRGITFNYSRCIACFCCQEACPSSAIKVKKSALAKMIGL